jgi:Fur family ferric uptake transcriptional regulator
MSEKNFKLTNQREVIWCYLKENYTHPSVEEIFNFVKTKLPRISKKTVYSNLQFLSEKGLINEVKIKGVQRYEPKLNPHHHLVCRNCGKMLDVESDELLSHAMKVGKKIKDFHVEFSNITFYGICKQCKEGKNGTRK